MSEASPQYNAQTVIDAATAKLREEGINPAQTVFQSALLDWVDDVTMGDMGEMGSESVRAEIAKLWLAYANLNRSSNLVSSISTTFLNVCHDCIIFLSEFMKRKRAPTSNVA